MFSYLGLYIALTATCKITETRFNGFTVVSWYKTVETVEIILNYFASRSETKCAVADDVVSLCARMICIYVYIYMYIYIAYIYICI